MFSFLKPRPARHVIEKFQFTDLPEIAAIHASSFGNAWDETTIGQMLNTPGMDALVVKSSGSRQKILAFLIYRTVAGEAEIITLASLPSARRTGVSRALMESFIRHALSERLKEIFLEVDDANFPALSLYRSLGFKKVGERRGYYNRDAKNEDMGTSSGNALIMRLDLEA